MSQEPPEQVQVGRGPHKPPQAESWWGGRFWKSLGGEDRQVVRRERGCPVLLVQWLVVVLEDLNLFFPGALLPVCVGKLAEERGLSLRRRL